MQWRSLQSQVSCSWYPAGRRAGAALLAALLLTSPTHYGAQYWATGALQHFGVLLYALGALFAIARGQLLWVAVPLALAAAFTSANGLMVFPAAALLLAIQHRRREALAWALAGALVLAIYLIGYTAPGGSGDLVSQMHEPMRLASLGLVSLGAIGGTFGIAVAIGGFVVFTWIALTVTGAWRRAPPLLVAAMVFCALTCAMIAVGRAVQGAEGVAISRYRVYSGFALLLTFAAVAWTVNARSLPWVYGTAIAGAAILYALAWMTMMPQLVHLSMRQAALRDHFAAEGHGHYDGFPQQFGDFTLNRAREIGAYDGVRHATSPVRAVGATPAIRHRFRTGPCSAISRRAGAQRRGLDGGASP